MATHRWQDVRKRRFTPEQIAASDARLDAELLELTLRTLREELGKTQQEIAAAADMSQGELSRAEARADHRVSTLRKIVSALGGELEVHAVFPDRKVKLSAV